MSPCRASGVTGRRGFFGTRRGVLSVVAYNTWDLSSRGQTLSTAKKREREEKIREKKKKTRRKRENKTFVYFENKKSPKNDTASKDSSPKGFLSEGGIEPPTLRCQRNW